MAGIAIARPPAWFTVLCVGALVWSLMGAYACYSQLTLTPEQMAALPTAQRDAFSSMPLTIKAAYILATAGGLVGAALLLLRRAAARIAFVASLAGIVIQFGWVFLAYGGAAKLGATAAIFPALIALVCLGEIALATIGARRGWLR